MMAEEMLNSSRGFLERTNPTVKQNNDPTINLVGSSPYNKATKTGARIIAELTLKNNPT